MPAPSIRKIGLATHLNQTRDQHKGRGYAEFAELVKLKVNPTNIARIFGVSRMTVAVWLGVYKDEHRDSAHED